MTQRPLVAAHRGASAEFAEHTRLGYAKAIEAGADALECDVRLTRDSKLVCIHDRTVDRTSNGHGIVATLTLDQLKAMDFASWKGNAEQYPEEVLELTDLLDLVRAAPRPVRLLIETKHPSRFSGLVEKELVGVLGDYGWADGSSDTIAVMSFAELALRRMRLLAPQIPTVLLFGRLRRGRRHGELPRGVGAAGPSLAVLRATPEAVERTQARDRRVFVWTVDEPADLRFVRELGVDVIITNRPGLAIDELAADSARSESADTADTAEIAEVAETTDADETTDAAAE